MQMTVQLPEVSEVANKIELLSKALRDLTIRDIFAEVLDSKEASRYLKISWRYLQVLKEKKEIPYSQHGTIVRYRKADLDRGLDKHRVSGGTTNLGNGS
ncbi:unnamed protein product [Phaeothamnion confervicola]